MYSEGWEIVPTKIQKSNVMNDLKKDFNSISILSNKLIRKIYLGISSKLEEMDVLDYTFKKPVLIEVGIFVLYVTDIKDVDKSIRVYFQDGNYTLINNLSCANAMIINTAFMREVDR